MVLADSIDFKDGYIYYSYHDYTVEGGDHVYGDVIGFEDCALMQSTGLFDVNGKEIFEGDVVEFEDADDIENVYINQGVIEWCQGGFTVSNRTTVTLDDLLDGDKLEVTIVGNIYENPELV
ncbi:TPA: YopX family protein, partial [Streptococcus suis]